MQIAQVLSGYTLGGADLLRRAMGKKDAEKMAKERDGFVKGAVERQVEPETASYIFDLIDKFAGYGFNKSHTAAYALVSYQTAWLKAHYPAAFMAAVLSSDMDKTDKVVVFIEECRRMGLKLASPAINVSEYRFTVGETGEIRYGLGAIKGVGEGAIEALTREREQGGPYRDLFDLCQRVDLHKLNRRVLESLIRSGAFDALGANRATLMAQLPEALQLAEQHSRNDAAGQNDMFGLATAEKTPARPLHIAKVPEWEEEERLRGEKETLGVYLTGHPIGRVAAELAALHATRLRDLTENGGALRRGSDRSVLIAGLVVSVRTRNANRGGRMAFVTLDDDSGRIEVRIFPEVYERYRPLIVEDAILLVHGTLGWDEFNQTTRLTVERVLELGRRRGPNTPAVWCCAWMRGSARRGYCGNWRAFWPSIAPMVVVRCGWNTTAPARGWNWRSARTGGSSPARRCSSGCASWPARRRCNCATSSRRRRIAIAWREIAKAGESETPANAGVCVSGFVQSGCWSRSLSSTRSR